MFIPNLKAIFLVVQNCCQVEMLVLNPEKMPKGLVFEVLDFTSQLEDREI